MLTKHSGKTTLEALSICETELKRGVRGWAAAQPAAAAAAAAADAPLRLMAAAAAAAAAAAPTGYRGRRFLPMHTLPTMAGERVVAGGGSVPACSGITPVGTVATSSSSSSEHDSESTPK